MIPIAKSNVSKYQKKQNPIQQTNALCSDLISMNNLSDVSISCFPLSYNLSYAKDFAASYVW